MDIITEERIDKYILGYMTAEEKAQFESDLKTDTELNDEYEAQKEIADGVQRVALKEFLTECEEKRAAKPSIEVVGLRSTIANIKEKFDSLASSGKKVVWSLSTAAVVAVAIIGGIDYSQISNAVQNAASGVYLATQVAIARDGNEIDNLLASAYAYIGEDQIEMAESLLAEVNTKIQDALKKPVVSDDNRVDHEDALIQQQDSEWYSAIILMKQGKAIKAKKTLKAIAESDGIHADEAREVLVNTYQTHKFDKK